MSGDLAFLVVLILAGFAWLMFKTAIDGAKYK
jgi:hypothetical protein